MSVSHARVSSSCPFRLRRPREQVLGLLDVLAQVADPRQKRGRRFTLVFVLAVAVVCVLAGARNFREAGDQAADLPQEVLAALGGRPHPLRRKIAAPSEKRIRTLLQGLDADALDVVIGGWLRALAAAGRLDGLLTAIAVDGKWLRGVGRRAGQAVRRPAARGQDGHRAEADPGRHQRDHAGQGTAGPRGPDRNGHHRRRRA